jgi:biotin synthase-like enzyme
MDIFRDSRAFLQALEKADSLTRKNGDYVTLERALFLSWWCDKGDCSFCYMSTQRPKLEDPLKARRKPWSILAEAEICSRIGWRIEFLSGGYGSYSPEEIRELAEMVAHVTGSPQWLNVGALKVGDLEQFGEEICGVVGSVETVNEELHRRVCPSKPVEPIVEMLKEARDLGLKTGITIILGLGESLEDIPALMDFISDLKLDRITYYSLNPHKGTAYQDFPPPASIYQAGIIAQTRIKFPEIEIIGGTWVDQLPNIGLMLLAGANGITKYPLFSMFGRGKGKKVEEEVRFANRRLLGTFSDLEILRGSKKLDRRADPRYIFPTKRPKVSRRAENRVQELRDRIDAMKENYLREFNKV